MGIEVQIDDRFEYDENNENQTQVRQTNDGPPGVSIGLESGPKRLELDPDAEAFVSEEAMAEAISKENEHGGLLIESDAGYKRYVESRVVASMSNDHGRWQDVGFRTGGNVKQPMEAPLAKYENLGSESAMIQLDE